MSSPKPLCDLKVAICIFHTIYALHTDLSLFMILTSLSPVARYFTSWLMKQLSWSWLSLPLIGSSSSDSVHFMLNSRVKKKPGSLDFISLPTTMKEQCSLLKWNLYLYIYIYIYLSSIKVHKDLIDKDRRIPSFKFYTKILVNEVLLCRGRGSSTLRFSLKIKNNKIFSWIYETAIIRLQNNRFGGGFKHYLHGSLWF